MDRFLETTSSRVVKLLIDKKISISCIESFTGGEFASTLCSVSGASKIFKGSVVTYSNEAKIAFGVKRKTINQYSSISSECAREMAGACQNIFNTSICVSFTGNAGPNPSEGHEIGLYYVCIRYLNQAGERVSKVCRFLDKVNSRNVIRRNAVLFAFEELERMCLSNTIGK